MALSVRLAPLVSAIRRQSQEVLRSGTNLVEIDLLHGGIHPVAVPRANLVWHGPFYGLVSVWRVAQPGQYEVYFVCLQDWLPRLRISLLPADPDVALGLPAIFTRCYAAARYDFDLDYTRPHLWHDRRQNLAGWSSGSKHRDGGQSHPLICRLKGQGGVAHEDTSTRFG